MLDLKGNGDFRLDPISITDCAGKQHEFQLRMFLRGGQVAVEAFELEDDAPAGHQFQILGDVDDDVLALVGRLIERIRPRLAVRYLLQDESGLQIVDRTVSSLLQSVGIANPGEFVKEALSESVQSEFQNNSQAAVAAGIFGSPSYLFGGELFFGQDRLDFLEEAIVASRGGSDSLA